MSEAIDSRLKNMCCNWCGISARSDIQILVRLPFPEGEETEYPYTQTDMCMACFKEHGVDAAFEHNRSIAEIEGLTQEDLKIRDVPG